MFTNEQLAEGAKDVIAEMTADPEVAWFVDANVVLSGDATKVLGAHRRMLSTPDVAAEVRKRPESKAANQLVTRIEQGGGLVTRETFSDSAAGFDMLVGCAKMLSPGVLVGKSYYIREMGMAVDAAEVRAIEGLGNAGEIFKSELMGNGIERGRLTLDKGTRRSWYRYPTKRRKQPGATYRFSDETLMATAVANALLRRQKTCVLSNDTDCAAIMKQLTDNLLWVVVAAEFNSRGVNPEIDVFIDRWKEWCRHVDEYREGVIDKRNSDFVADESESPVLYRFAPDEVVVCRLTDLVISGFAYPIGVSDFVRTVRHPVVWTCLDDTPR